MLNLVPVHAQIHGRLLMGAVAAREHQLPCAVAVAAHHHVLIVIVIVVIASQQSISILVIA